MELKFRAWDKITEQMYSVGYIDIVNKNVQIATVDEFGNCYAVYVRNVKDVILMQYTGLKDNNETEIYEGDIIANQDRNDETWHVSHHKVVWHDTGFMGKQIYSSGSYIGLQYWTEGKNGYVVIGNIYENPELLDWRRSNDRQN